MAKDKTVRGQSVPSTAPGLAIAGTIVLWIVGLICVALAAYIFVSLRKTETVVSLMFLGIASILIGCFLPRLRGRFKFGLKGLDANLTELPAAASLAPSRSKEIRLQLVTADAAITPSHATAVRGMLSRSEPLDFVEIDLGTGGEWLTSRLFITAELTRRARGARSMVFVNTKRGVSRNYLGIADIASVRWGLAQLYPYLEFSFVAAVARAYRHSWPISDARWHMLWTDPGMDYPRNPASPEEVSQTFGPDILSVSGALPPEVMSDIFFEYLTVLRTTPQPNQPPPAGWVELGNPAYWEYASWLQVDALHKILGSALDSGAVQRSAEGTVDLEDVLVWGGPIVPIVDRQNRFIEGVDRAATVARQKKG
jgi:hypothetical protein